MNEPAVFKVGLKFPKLFSGIYNTIKYIFFSRNQIPVSTWKGNN